MTNTGRRTLHVAQNDRKILFIHPTYNRAFGTFYHMYQFFPDVRAFMAPLGILIVMGYLPRRWKVRFIDQNAWEITEADLEWADVVLVSGMHVQRPVMNAINDRAHAHGKMTVLGGCSVSAAPEDYPEFDVLHVGEIGDATDQLIAFVDQQPIGVRPLHQLVFTTKDKLALEEFPTPVYDQINLNQYLVATIQFSSGCPFRCEFCDIPALYGRNPRLKSAEKIRGELDAIKASGYVGGVYFVDDNFIGNPKAARALLPDLIAWQRENRYPFRFGIEATINLATFDDLLALMRDANVTDCYFGIESPDEGTLNSINKQQNLHMPILAALDKIRNYGIEAHCGVILGFDSDTNRTEEFLLDFIHRCNCPLIAVNMLFALPKTPLWDRLAAEGRLLPHQQAFHTNIRFRLPQERVLAMWRNCSRAAYEPQELYRRYMHNIEHTYTQRLQLPLSRYGVSWRRLLLFLITLRKIFWIIGVRSRYRRCFWRMVARTLHARHFENLIHVSVMGHHLIEFGKDCETDAVQASQYAKAPVTRPIASSVSAG